MDAQKQAVQPVPQSAGNNSSGSGQINVPQCTAPTETEDVANVVARLLYPCVFDDIDDRRRCEKIVIAALADARKGLHSEEEIEKALQDEVEQWPGYESWYKCFTKNVLGHLKPRSQSSTVSLDGTHFWAVIPAHNAPKKTVAE